MKQAGRSMVETLGVLALVGVLSIAAVAGISIARDKNRANTIVNDSKIAYLNAANSKQINTVWEAVQFKPDSGKEMAVRFDLLGYPFVLVKAVEKGVCRQMLPMRTENVLDFYDTANVVLTDCAETNDIIIDWNGFGPPAMCFTVADCPKPDGGFNGICDDRHQCAPCADIEMPNDGATKCVCNPEKALTCASDTDTWCCGEGTICGTDAPTCIPSNYSCVYEFYENGTADTLYYTDCSYAVMDKDTMTYGGDCSYNVLSGDDITGYGGDCKATVVKQSDTFVEWADGTGTVRKLYQPDGTVFVAEVGACPANQYCALQWADVDNDGVWDMDATTLAEADFAGTVWGKCQMLSTFQSMPLIKGDSGVPVTERTGCPANQYCALQWVDADNDGAWDVDDTTLAEASDTGVIWGKCQMLSMFQNTPVIKNDNGGVPVTEIVGCPENQYCALQWSLPEWTPKDEKPMAAADYIGVVYGRCQMMSTFMPEPLSKNDVGNTRYNPILDCPANTYCALQWLAEGVCTEADADKTGAIYGVCTELNKGGVCPYPAAE